MILISGTDGWRNAHPGAVIGLLEISGVENNHEYILLNNRKREIEAELVEQYSDFSRQKLVTLPIAAPGCAFLHPSVPEIKIILFPY